MKKLIAILFLLSYGFTSVGATMHTHYCMGKQVGVSFTSKKNSKCGKCGMPEKTKKGCCKDEQQLIKVDDGHQKAIIEYTFNKIACEVIINPIFTFYFKQNYIKALIPLINAPPPKQNNAIIKLVCCYRI